ncbi:putative reverse transcriptase domain-containing protein [Tanacetum coccineum]
MTLKFSTYGKANVVADALSRKERVKPTRVRAMNMILQSSIKDMIPTAQKEVVDESARLQKGLDEMIELETDGVLYYLDQIWVPLKGDVRTLIMDEAHKSKYSVHPGADKMYYDLRDRYWWHGVKKDIANMYYDYDAHVKGELLDCDGIPKRPAMFLNLWRYKVVRHRYSNPMIQPEPEGSTQGYPLVSVEVLRFYTSAGYPVNETLLKLNLPDHRILKDGGEDFRYSDTERLSRSVEVLKLKNFKKDATLKLFKSTNQECPNANFEMVVIKAIIGSDVKQHSQHLYSTKNLFLHLMCSMIPLAPLQNKSDNCVTAPKG